ncbi:MAG: cyclic nucleotide-binding domain-containing protein [Actinomycetota bacterium]|nr:cyclic nucleotide-binding domain-containing protein [Actinomycetota bacterium]
MPRPLRKDAKIELIAKVPLFAGLAKQQLTRVASIADEIDLPEGKILTRQGERGREFFILLEGEAEVRRNGRKLATRRAGEFFGEIALISDIPRVATVTATTPVRALVIRDREFRALLERTPAIALDVLTAVAERLPTTARDAG